MEIVLRSPATELAQKLRSAAKTGRRLHLDPCHVSVLMGDAIYLTISAREALEIRLSCAEKAINDNSLETIGSGSVKTLERGASVGSTAVQVDPIGRGARLRLSEARSELMLRKKQSMH